MLCSSILANCSRADLMSSSYMTTFDLIYEYFDPGDDLYTAELVKNIPYASSLISFNGKNKSLIILEEIRKNEKFWISRDKVRFKENNGRIVQTIGLPNDLYDISRPTVTFKEILNRKKLNYVSYYSFRKPQLNNLKVFITSQVTGIEQVDILGVERNLTLIQEQIFAPRINWKEENKYWIDTETDINWKSLQHISPKLPPIEIELTKKPAN